MGRGLDSGPGEAAASWTRAEPQPTAQLPRPPHPPGQRLPPRAPPPVRSSPGFPLAPASCCRESRRCASASVASRVGSGDGRGGRSRSGALGSAAGSRRERLAPTSDAPESREGLAPAGSLWPPRPPGCSGPGVGVEGEVGEPAETAREREGQEVEGHGKRPGEDESVLCVLLGREGRCRYRTEGGVSTASNNGVC